MPHIPDLTAIRSGQNFRLPKPPRALQNLLLLLCSLLAGLLPLLLWASLILLWYYSPWQFSADISYLSLAMFAASPFCAGFAGCRWRRSYSLATGAWPAFLLWLAAAGAYSWLFGLPRLEKAAATLVLSLLLGIAGAMSAARISKIRRAKTPGPTTPPPKAD